MILLSSLWQKEKRRFSRPLPLSVSQSPLLSVAALGWATSPPASPSSLPFSPGVAALLQPLTTAASCTAPSSAPAAGEPRQGKAAMARCCRASLDPSLGGSAAGRSTVPRAHPPASVSQRLQRLPPLRRAKPRTMDNGGVVNHILLAHFKEEVMQERLDELIRGGACAHRRRPLHEGLAVVKELNHATNRCSSQNASTWKHC